jgi:EpsI family protein
MLAGTLLFAGWSSRRISEPLVYHLDEFPKAIAGWSASQNEALDAGVIKQLAPTEYLSRTYRKGASEADLFIAYYAQQRAGESMHSPKHCLPGAGWEIWNHDSAVVRLNDRQTVNINKYSIHNSGDRMLMFYWYQSKDRIFANEYLGKVLLAHDTLLTGRTGGSIARIMLPDTPSATQEGVLLAAEVIRELQRSLGSATASN